MNSDSVRVSQSGSNGRKSTKSTPNRPKFARTKKTKLVLNFDQDERESFLKGFQKRKSERKQKAKQLLEQQVKEEMKRIKDKHQAKLKKMYEEMVVATDMDSNCEYSVQYELPEQTVNIKGLDLANMSGTVGLSMGVNKATEAQEEDICKSGSDQHISSSRKEIRKLTSKELKKCQVLKRKQRLQTKKDKQRKRYGVGSSLKSTRKRRKGP